VAAPTRVAGCSQGLKKARDGWTAVPAGEGVGATPDGEAVGAAATGVGVAALATAGAGSLEAAAPMPFVPTAVAKTISEFRT